MKRVIRGGLAFAMSVAVVAGVSSGAEEVGASSSTHGKGCGAGVDRKAPQRAQEKAMRCLISKLRDRAGIRRLSSDKRLERAAGMKARDVKRCGFSHTACGLPADQRADQTGYIGGRSWKWGENLALGKRRRGTAKAIFRAWMNSPPHRQTMLTGAFEDLGIGLRGGGKTAVWVLQVGCHGC